MDTQCKMLRYKVLNARPRDLGWLPGIELAAATLLISHAPASVFSETTCAQEFEDACAEARLWVALADDRPVGFVHVELLANGAAHLKEIDVHPDHGRRGLGAQLVDVACEWAASRGHEAITLTTFCDVPWNMPFYASKGFKVIASNMLSVDLLQIVAEETSRGLDPARRVVMRRYLKSM